MKNKIKKFLVKGNLSNQDNRKNAGITLVALVITIVVLIILATLVIGITIGQNGILNRAKQAIEDYKVRANEEQEELAKAGNIESTRDNTSIGPAGSVIAFMGDNEPDGYLKCEGQAVSRTTYSALFTAIGTKYGEGDGSTTFNVPDLRGEFLRGTGTNSHSNQGNGGTVGEHQNSTQIPYLAYYGDSNNMNLHYSNGENKIIYADKIISGGTKWRYISSTGGFNNSSQDYQFAIRPTNTSVLYCIKY